MNWGNVLTWLAANMGNIIAAVMVIVRLVEAAIAAGKTNQPMVKTFFTLRRS